MRLRPEQLAGQPADVLLPMYLVSGEEPFQLGQVCDAIRQRAHDAGYTNRTVMQVDRSFDWQTL
ncbi:MAG: DNA polymerase III subunit delta, partial [Proteobacteria bacterium]|nr:DNA polymerase III subunit delta [Pseudomonadota bacterium]